MPLSYPLPRETFFDILPIASMSLDLPESVEVGRTGAGEQLSASRGERLWQGALTVGRLTRAEASRPEVLVDLLRAPGRTFLAYDVRRPAPRLDPAGAILGAATPTIMALGGDAREMSLAGLPAGYALSAGDFLAFTYLTGPVRYALHRVVDPTVTANGTGQTPLFEVTPAIRPGATAGAAVTLVKPCFKAQLVFGSVQPMMGRRTIFEGQAFEFVQTLR